MAAISQTYSFTGPFVKQNQPFTGRTKVTYYADQNAVWNNVNPSDQPDFLAAGYTAVSTGGQLNNLAATSNPLITSDKNSGYGVGSTWLNTSTGQLFICSDATVGAAQWTNLRAGDVPLVAARFYGIPMGSTQAAVLTVSGTLYAYPVFIPNKIALQTLNISVTTGQTGGKVRAALFYDNAGYPGAIVAGTDSGDLAATSTAVGTSGTLNVTLSPGVYWVGIIATASSTMPSVIGATAVYPNSLVAQLGFDTAAHALATSGEASTGIALTGQTYPATNMATSFPTFPASAALTLNATTPIAALGF